MPDYIYKCPNCDKVEEVNHSMSEVKNPSEELQRQTSCNSNTCKHAQSFKADAGVIPEYGVRWERVPQAPHLGGMSGGSTVGERSLLKKKQASRKLRSKKHFKNEVLPTLNETPKITKHFKDKFKDI